VRGPIAGRPRSTTVSRCFVAGTLVLAAVGGSRVHAITDEEIFRQLRFNFINPGARALGFGGAFIGIADDATAAQVNAAGLIQLSQPQFFMEERVIGSDTTVGRENSVPDFAFTSENERRAISTPTFFAYVHPLQHLTLGFSRQELLNTRFRVESQFDFALGTVAIWSGTGDIAVHVTNWNATVAWPVGGHLSLGATATFARLEIDSTVQNFILDRAGVVLCSPGGPIDCTAPAGQTALEHPQDWYRTQIGDKDAAFAYSVGALVTPSENLGIGVVFRSGAGFRFEQQRIDGLSGSVGLPPLEKASATFRQTLNLPDSYGAGVKWQVTPRVKIAADLVHIQYSSLLADLSKEMNVLTAVANPGTAGGRFPTRFGIDDVTEVHLGAELRWVRQATTGEKAHPESVWLLRGGVFTDPDNVLQDRSGSFGDALGGRDNVLHYALGFGAVQQNVQVDFALSHSSLGNEAVVSLIHEFRPE